MLSCIENYGVRHSNDVCKTNLNNPDGNISRHLYREVLQLQRFLSPRAMAIEFFDEYRMSKFAPVANYLTTHSEREGVLGNVALRVHKVLEWVKEKLWISTYRSSSVQVLSELFMLGNYLGKEIKPGENEVLEISPKVAKKKAELLLADLLNEYNSLARGNSSFMHSKLVDHSKLV